MGLLPSLGNTPPDTVENLFHRWFLLYGQTILWLIAFRISALLLRATTSPTNALDDYIANGEKANTHNQSTGCVSRRKRIEKPGSEPEQIRSGECGDHGNGHNFDEYLEGLQHYILFVLSDEPISIPTKMASCHSLFHARNTIPSPPIAQSIEEYLHNPFGRHIRYWRFFLAQTPIDVTNKHFPASFVPPFLHLLHMGIGFLGSRPIAVKDGYYDLVRGVGADMMSVLESLESACMAPNGQLPGQMHPQCLAALMWCFGASHGCGYRKNGLDMVAGERARYR